MVLPINNDLYCCGQIFIRLDSCLCLSQKTYRIDKNKSQIKLRQQLQETLKANNNFSSKCALSCTINQIEFSTGFKEVLEEFDFKEVWGPLTNPMHNHQTSIWGFMLDLNEYRNKVSKPSEPLKATNVR